MSECYPLETDNASRGVHSAFCADRSREVRTHYGEQAEHQEPAGEGGRESIAGARDIR